MRTVGYYNGEIAEVSELKIPVLDRAVYFGDGVYDVAICVNKKAFTLDYHIERFYRSIKGIGINFTMDRTEFKELLESLIAKCNSTQLMVYFQASRGVAARTHTYPLDMEASLLIMITPFKLGDMRKKLKLVTSEDKRALYCNIKTINLIPNVLASEHAYMNECDETVLHRGDIVTECAHSSLMLLKDGELVVPPLNDKILPGITRKIVEEICEKKGINVVTKEFTINEMFAADEIIVASTTKNIAGVYEIDSRPVGGKDEKLLEKLQDLFEKRLLAETK